MLTRYVDLDTSVWMNALMATLGLLCIILALLPLLAIYTSLTGHWPGDPYALRQKPFARRTPLTEGKLFLVELRRRLGRTKSWYDKAALEAIKEDVVQLVQGYVISQHNLDSSQKFLLFYGVKEASLGAGSVPFMKLRKIHDNNEALTPPAFVSDEVFRLIGNEDTWLSHIFNRDYDIPDEVSIPVPFIPDELSAHARLEALRRYQSFEGARKKEAA